MVSGKNQHPLYAWLTNKKLNGYKNSTVRWNFQKYLINPEGNIINYFYSNTSPLSKKITKYLS
jgi:glutathione peroxidase